jgi:hypothetical protein
MRDQSLGSTFVIDFTTHSLTTDELIAPSAAFVESDFRIYKVSSSNEKTSNNGITIDSPFDTLVGNHRLSIDTSNSTGDVGFWASGEAYNVVIVTAKTVDGKSISGRIVASFSIERQTADVRKIGGDSTAAANLALSAAAICTGTVDTGASTTSIPTSAFSPAVSAVTANQLVGRIVIFRRDTTTVALRGQATDITASTASATPALTVTALTVAPAADDVFVVV